MTILRSKIKIFSFIILTVFIFSGFGCKNSAGEPYKVDLEIWGLFDDSGALSEIIKAYTDIHPYVKSITYRKFTTNDYKAELIDAMAAGKGPDIFMIHHTWVSQFEDKMTPSPDGLITEQAFKNQFVDVVANDFLKDGKVVALPLSVDSLALYYNKDFFNRAGLTKPPQTWDEFDKAVEQFTKIDSFGNIERSGAALGTALNVNRSPDIIALLMMQRGVDFSVSVPDLGSEPALSGFNYYLDFARSSSTKYTWNQAQHYSIDAFYEGKTAMMINYSWHRATIKAKNPKLNFGIAPLPQFSENDPQNFANYFGYVVKNNTDVRVLESWEFLKYLTMKNPGSMTLKNALSGNSRDFPIAVDPGQMYMDKTGNPPARRDLIEKLKTDPELSAYAYGNLISKSWPRSDNNVADELLGEAVTNVLTGVMTPKDALGRVSARLRSLEK